MRRNVLLPIVLGVAAWFSSAAADDSSPPPDKTRDSYDLVVLAPSYPVFMRLYVQVDGAGLKGVRFAYAEKLVKQYDRNGDGVVDFEEAARIPPLVKSSNASETFSVSEGWVSVDRSPPDEQVTAAELADWIDRILGFPLSFREPSAQPAVKKVDLFGLMDINHDGRLSRDEITNADRTLHKLDLDENGEYAIRELQPLLRQELRNAGATATPQSSNLPFLLLADEESIRSTAVLLIQRYARTEEGGQQPAGGLAFPTLGLDEHAAGRLDSDRDGKLNAAELEQFLRSPAPQVELSAGLVQGRTGRPRLDVVGDGLSFVAAEKNRRPDRLTLSAENVQLEWRVSDKNRREKLDNLAFYGQGFDKADKGEKKKYLNEQEFATLRLANATFAQVDQDGNGMIVKEELAAFVAQRFDSADKGEKKKGRLTEQEFATLGLASVTFAQTDRDGNGMVVKEELAAFVGQRFDSADKGEKKKGYLTEQEFATLGLANATFAQTDRDGNGMVVKKELMAVVNQESDSSQMCFEMTVAHDGKSVFQLLDENLDRRITHREIRKAVDRLHAFDRNGDGEISTVELTGKFVVTLQMGTVPLFRSNSSPPGDGGNLDPNVPPLTEGPQWHRKMDRNRDLDVSRREFLGLPETFRKLDADGDGMISLGEAEKAGAP